MNPDIASIPIRDIHLPETVSWWPLAPGWWITIGLFLLAAIVVYVLKSVRNRQQLSKQSMDEFSELVARYQNDGDAKSLIANVSELLRRVSITQFSHQEVAALTGKRWLQFLDSAFEKLNTRPPAMFHSEVGEYLISIQYQKQDSVDPQKLDQLLVLSKAWLQTVCKKPTVAKEGVS